METLDGARAIRIASAAQLACLLEASAPKPGNVSPGRPFRDAAYEDFVTSAVAIGEPLSRAGERPLGLTIRRAVEATRTWTSSNTNLGLVLLLAPIARAAIRSDQGSADLRRSVQRILEETSLEDTREVYAAIRLASPGGLGDAPSQHVRQEPTVPLTDAMRLAAHRDTIAREYATAFETTFTRGLPALERARGDALTWNDAVVEVFLTVLSTVPDTHIARRAGDAAARIVSDDARRVLDAGGVRTAHGRSAIDAFDAQLRDAANSRNPGTTADLTAAALFVFLVNGGWDQFHRPTRLDS